MWCSSQIINDCCVLLLTKVSLAYFSILSKTSFVREARNSRPENFGTRGPLKFVKGTIEVCESMQSESMLKFRASRTIEKKYAWCLKENYLII